MKTGTVLICSIDDMPFIKHQGIVINRGGKDLVAHCTPEAFNRYGGNIVIEPYERFIRGRKVIAIERTGATYATIMDYVSKNVSRKFDSLAFNCFQFVHSTSHPAASR